VQIDAVDVIRYFGMSCAVGAALALASAVGIALRRTVIARIQPLSR